MLALVTAQKYTHDMSTTTEFTLSAYDCTRLGEASQGLYSSWAAEERVTVYVRRGYSIAEAVEFAITWAKNMVEQYDRRLAHGTGAEGWRRQPWWDVVE